MLISSESHHFSHLLVSAFAGWRSYVRTEGVSDDEADSDTEGDSGDDQDSHDSGDDYNDDFPESIVDIKLRSMLSWGPLNLTGVFLRSGQINEFNSQGGG